MKEFKHKLKSFIYEMITGVICITIILFGLIYTDLIVITIRLHLLTVTAILFLVSILLYIYCKTINLGIKALCDFFIPGYTEIQGTFIKQYPYSSGTFSDKWNKDHTIQNNVRYYIVILDNNNKYITLISSDYLDVEVGKQFTFFIGKCSHIILDCHK